MKKNVIIVLCAIAIGFFMGKTFLEQYEGYNGIKVTSSSGEILYFIKYGEYGTLEEMESETISLSNYIYNEVNDKYYVYIGITKNKDNLIKLNNYFNSLGYIVYTEEFLVTNESFLKMLENYDSILANTDDSVVISSISNQILTKYEECVINGS